MHAKEDRYHCENEATEKNKNSLANVGYLLEGVIACVAYSRQGLKLAIVARNHLLYIDGKLFAFL